MTGEGRLLPARGDGCAWRARFPGRSRPRGGRAPAGRGAPSSWCRFFSATRQDCPAPRTGALPPQFHHPSGPGIRRALGPGVVEDGEGMAGGRRPARARARPRSRGRRPCAVLAARAAAARRRPGRSSPAEGGEPGLMRPAPAKPGATAKPRRTRSRRLAARRPRRAAPRAAAGPRLSSTAPALGGARRSPNGSR